MSKAIVGAGLLGGAAILAIAFTGGFGLAAEGLLAGGTGLSFSLFAGLALGGISMEAGAIAGALASNRGSNITTRQPAANRQVVYGPQKIGGIIIYPSTTGAAKDQYNKVIVLAGHELWAIEALYLDGRRVWFNESSGGSTTRNGYTFGGSADSGQYEGPGGQQYNFGGLVYCEARYGDQLPGDVITGLTANDPTWAPSTDGSPYVGGCAYVYVKIEYNTTEFPSEPEIRLVVHGKPVWDPRTSAFVASNNPALVMADILVDPVFGLGESAKSVNQDQLIAAANVCDELVMSEGAGRVESRYAIGIHYDSALGPSDALSQVAMAMGGRMSYIGGQFYIWPAYWQGPAFSFDYKDLTAEVSWTPYRSFKDLANCVRGTYTSPNFPYNILGNAYDSHGFDSDGNVQNNFQNGWIADSYPQYAVDPLHGYAANEYLNEDSGVQGTYDATVTYAEDYVVSYTQVVSGKPYASVWRSVADGNIGNTPGPTSTAWVNASVELPFELALPMVLSLSQAQRLAKIQLLRNRMQGAGSLELRVSSLCMQPLDVFQMTFPFMGWTNKQLEITTCSPLRIVEGSNGQPPSIRMTFGVQETASTIYDWDPVTEEESIYGTPVIAQTTPRVVAPPTNLALLSNAATAISNADGTATPRIEFTWDTPADGFVTVIQSQYRVSGSSVWLNGPDVDVSLNAGYIPNIVAGLSYDVQIRSLRPGGAYSIWVYILGFGSSLTLGSQTAVGLGQGSLVGEAYADGTAAIDCQPFTARVGQVALSIFSGPVTLIEDGTLGGSSPALSQQVTYWVYYIDLDSVGGNVTPIATTNQADFLGKNGYWLIGSIVTPLYSTAGGGTGTRYYPGTVSDTGSRSTLAPQNAYDQDLTTAAIISGQTTVSSASPPVVTTAYGACAFQFLTPVALSADGTLSVDFDSTTTTVGSGSGSGGAAIVQIIATLGSNPPVTMFSSAAGSLRGTVTCVVPAHTPINQISVSIYTAPPTGTFTPSGGGTGHYSGSASCSAYEIYITS
jgi:hypothetical protein